MLCDCGQPAHHWLPCRTCRTVELLGRGHAVEVTDTTVGIAPRGLMEVLACERTPP